MRARVLNHQLKGTLDCNDNERSNGVGSIDHVMPCVLIYEAKPGLG